MVIFLKTWEAESLKHHFGNATVLITGGVGFIGSVLVKTLVGMGTNVTIIDSLNPNCGDNLANITGVRDKIRLNVLIRCGLNARGAMIEAPVWQYE